MHADFSWGCYKHLLYIIDANIGNKSVTNDIEHVLESIRNHLHSLAPKLDFFSLMKFKIIYRDSEFNWDGVELKNDKFFSFYSLNTKSFKEAAIKVSPTLDDDLFFKYINQIDRACESTMFNKTLH